MKICADSKQFNWISDAVSELKSNADIEWKGNFVSHLMPSDFEAYVKVLHGIAGNYEHIDNPLNEREQSLLRIPKCERLRKFVEDARRTGIRIRWRMLANSLGVPFQRHFNYNWFFSIMESGCWARFIVGPDDGNLDSQELQTLISVLKQFTSDQECFFRFAEMPFIGTDEPLLVGGTLDQLVGFLNQQKYQFTPEYWWPFDRSWCLCTDYDLTFTVIGGSSELISRVLEDAELESVPVTPDTRIDDKAPIER